MTVNQTDATANEPDYECDWCGHDHRHDGKCRWVDGWDGGAPTLFCACEKVWRKT